MSKSKQSPKFNNPFEQQKNELEKLVRAPKNNPQTAKIRKHSTLQERKDHSPNPNARADHGANEDRNLFLQATQNVTRMPKDERTQEPTITQGSASSSLESSSQQLTSQFAQGKQEDSVDVLLEFVSEFASTEQEETTEFEWETTDSFIEGAIKALDSRIIKKLKRGEFTPTRKLDLHGFNRIDAELMLIKFIQSCRKDKIRSALVVHGKGFNSADRVPIIKQELKAWLSKGKIAAHILAFTSALPQDGGTGAVYILMRR